MVFGILESRTGLQPVGTTLLEDIHENASGNGRGQAEIILVPQPSNPPEDPLNMCRIRKELLFLTIVFGACATGVIGPLLVPGFSIIATAFQVTLTQVSILNGSLVMALGISSYLCSCFTTVYGKTGRVPFDHGPTDCFMLLGWGGQIVWLFAGLASFSRSRYGRILCSYWYSIHKWCILRSWTGSSCSALEFCSHLLSEHYISHPQTYHCWPILALGFLNTGHYVWCPLRTHRPVLPRDHISSRYPSLDASAFDRRYGKWTAWCWENQRGCFQGRQADGAFINFSVGVGCTGVVAYTNDVC